MSLNNQVQELNSIQKEIKKLQMRKADLAKKALLLKESIIRILEHENLPGVKCDGGGAVYIQKKKAFETKSKKEKQLDSEELLSRYGISDPKKMLEELDRLKRGVENDKTVLQVTTVKAAKTTKPKTTKPKTTKPKAKK